MHAIRILAPLSLALVLSACADFGGPINQDPDALSPEERRLQAMEERLSDLTRRVEGITQTGLGQTQPRLADEVRMLRGEVEKLRNDLDRSERRSRELYLDVDRRLQGLETGTARPSPVAPAAPRGTAPASPEEQGAYLAAFDLLKAGKYDDAILGFENQLENWPEGGHAASARYWTGEAYYVKRDYAKAISSFQDLLQKHPDSDRAPDALLKIGFAQQELGNNADARETLERLVRDHRQSTAANLARQRLEQLGRQN